jgi:hypothetical protein
MDSIIRRYFDNQQVLFPASAQGFAEMIAYGERLVGIFNRLLGEELERPAKAGG